jgi:hypothetical protein
LIAGQNLGSVLEEWIEHILFTSFSARFCGVESLLHELPLDRSGDPLPWVDHPPGRDHTPLSFLRTQTNSMTLRPVTRLFTSSQCTGFFFHFVTIGSAAWFGPYLEDKEEEEEEEEK